MCPVPVTEPVGAQEQPCTASRQQQRGMEKCCLVCKKSNNDTEQCRFGGRNREYSAEFISRLNSQQQEQEIRDVPSQEFWFKCYEKEYLTLQEAKSWRKRT